MQTRKIKISDYDFPLPEERIALHPLPKRDDCRLLVCDASHKISHDYFFDLPRLLRPDTLIVANETRVIRARMEFFKTSGSRIEVFLLEPLSPSDYVLNFASENKCSWSCMVGNRKRWKEAELEKFIKLDGGEEITLRATLGQELPGNAWEVRFEWDNRDISFARVVEAAGNIPIPPYLKRKSEESDTTDYQTVYSVAEGSVAAPTAGLHFTRHLIDELKKDGHDFATVTLHVGAGTFQPVKVEEIGAHPMHTEWISVSKATVIKILEALRSGRDILAIGTTSVRTLESLPYLGYLLKHGNGANLNVGQWMPYEKENVGIDTVDSLETILNFLIDNSLDTIEATTAIMIAPGFKWRIVNRLITNFHQPKSTLLLLVSSFLESYQEKEKPKLWRKVYDEALKEGYRFLSYGDACLFLRSMAVELPDSKSIALRVATLNAIAGKEISEIIRILRICDDTEDFLMALSTLYNQIQSETEPGLEKVVFRLGATPLRFFIALAASMPGVWLEISAAEELARRPLKPLLEALREAGADIISVNDDDRLPLRIRGRKLTGGNIHVETSVSSQYLSALLLASTLWEKKPNFIIEGEVISSSYLRMTERLIERGITGNYSEPDWSAAAFFYETALLFPGRKIEVARLTPPSDSLQGDAVCLSIFETVGVETQFRQDGSCQLQGDGNVIEKLRNSNEMLEINLSASPDLMPAITAALTVAGIKFTINGIAHVRRKESDRIESMRRELGKLGYVLLTTTDSITYKGDKTDIPAGAVIDTYSDHRIAMAFAPLEALGLCVVADRNVVAKSYPAFWRNFRRMSL